MHALVRRRTRRSWARSPAVVALAVALGLLATFLTTVVLAPPADAHATVESSDPRDEAHLATAPHMVTVRFSESVNPELGGLKVINQQRREVQTMSHQTAGDTLMAMLPPDLADGTYVANYRIISEDGHPINGSIRFAVGAADLADTAALTEKTDPTMDALTKVGQFLTYAGALLTAGLAFFLAFLYEPGPERGRLALIARIGTAVAVVGMVVVLLSQAAMATGGGLGSLFSGGTAGTVLRQGLGLQDAGVLTGLVLCLVSLSVPRGVPSQSCALWGGVAATASFALWGHALEGERSWLKLPADAVHLVAAGVWFGGLVGLAYVLRTRATAAGTLVPAGAAPVAAGAARPAAETVDASATTGTADPAVAADRETAGAVAAGGTGARASVALDEPSASMAAPAADDVVVLPDAVADDGAGAVLTEPAPGDDDTVIVVGGSGAGPDGADGAPAAALASAVRILRRFSAAAFVSLLALTAAGLALGLLEVGPLGDALSTNYGRLLAAKLAVVAVVAAVAGYNRFALLPWLLRDRSADDPADQPDEAEVRAGWRTLLRTVVFEAGSIVVVLGLTAVLVNTTPGAPAGGGSDGPFQETKAMKAGKAALTVTPNQPGKNSMHIDLTGADGKPRDVREVQVELANEESGVAFTRKAVHGGPGHYLIEGSGDLTLGGTWDIDLVVQFDQFNEERVSFKDEMG